jgi:hypothetical protein
VLSSGGFPPGARIGHNGAVSSLDLSWAMKGVDAVLRQRLGIAEFTDDPDCLIRISRVRAPRTIALSAGAAVRPGEPVLHIHLWNEHLPVLPRDGRTASWANLFKRRMRHSLALLAHHIERDADYRDIVAITAAPAFPDRFGPLSLTRVCEHFGWEIVPPEQPHGLRSLHVWLDSLLIWGLIWAFNPAGLRGRGVAHGRIEVWMSRARLLDRYGRNAAPVGPS